MRKLVFIFVLSALASTSNAALISTDLYSQGDGLLTLDTDTGLEWLDQSVCVSYTLAEINQCGLPSGFRTVPDSGGGDINLEIRTFLEHAGVDDFKFARTSGGTNNNTIHFVEHRKLLRFLLENLRINPTDIWRKVIIPCGMLHCLNNRNIRIR